MVASTRGLADQHLLEAALQRGVLLDVLAVFVQRGRADAVQLAARQRGLEHVAGVHRAFGLAGADHGVQLVDEDDGLAFVLAPASFSTVFSRSSNSPRYLAPASSAAMSSDQHALVLQRIGHLAGDDALRQAFDDGGLAHAGLADQHRVVLGAALQHLDGAADLVVAADHRVELAHAGALGQVDACTSSAPRAGLRLRRESTFWPPRTASIAASSALRVRPLAAHDAADVALASASASRNISLAMNWSPRLIGFLLGGLQQLDQVAARPAPGPGPAPAGSRFMAASAAGQQAGHVDAGALQQGLRAVVLAAAWPPAGGPARCRRCRAPSASVWASARASWNWW